MVCTAAQEDAAFLSIKTITAVLCAIPHSKVDADFSLFEKKGLARHQSLAVQYVLWSMGNNVKSLSGVLFYENSVFSNKSVQYGSLITFYNGTAMNVYHVF